MCETSYPSVYSRRGQLPDDYRTVKHLINFDKAPDKVRDKVYSTPGGALIY